jgi:ABC-type multidrug transport system ATPase subunit
MGASGAGKTTLLNVMACRVPRNQLEGKICANGQEYTY